MVRLRHSHHLHPYLVFVLAYGGDRDNTRRDDQIDNNTGGYGNTGRPNLSTHISLAHRASVAQVPVLAAVSLLPKG